MWNKERGVQAFLACVTMLFGLSSAMPVLSADSSSAALTGAKAEEGRNAQESDQVPVAPPGESELVPELEDRLVILPEIKREGERFFLSSFKLPDKLTFAGQAIPLDNWQVRERIGEVWLVFDKQHTGHERLLLFCGGVAGPPSGILSVKVDPRPGCDHTRTSPSCRCATCFTIASPSPVPPVRRERAWWAR